MGISGILRAMRPGLSGAGLLAGLAIAIVILFAPAAHAEMGKGPAAKSDFYFGLFGGWVHEDGLTVNGHGDFTFSTFPLDSDNGGFAGFEFGMFLNPASAPAGLANARVEAAFSGNFPGKDSASSTGGIIFDIDGGGGITNGAPPAGSDLKREIYDLSVALKGETGTGFAQDLTVALELFFR